MCACLNIGYPKISWANDDDLLHTSPYNNCQFMCGLITHFQTANHRKGCPVSSSKRRSRRTQASPSPRPSSWGKPAAVRRRCTSSTYLDLVDIGRFEGKSIRNHGFSHEIQGVPVNVPLQLQCIEFIRVHAHSTAKQTLKSSVPSVPIYIVKYSPMGPKNRRYSKYGSRYGKNAWRKSSSLPTWWNGWPSPGYLFRHLFGVFSSVLYWKKYRGRFSILLVIVYLKGPTDYNLTIWETVLLHNQSTNGKRTSM